MATKCFALSHSMGFRLLVLLQQRKESEACKQIKQDPLCHSWLSMVFICFLSISSASSWPPASSSIINHRSSWYITSIYHNHVCHYNRHLVVSTLGLYAPGSAFRFRAHSPSLQQVCGQDSPGFVEADGFLFLLCKKHEYITSALVVEAVPSRCQAPSSYDPGVLTG